MKKVLSILLVMMLMFSMTAMFTGCGGSGNGGSGGGTDNGGGTEATTYKIQLAHVEAEDRSTHQGALKFKEAVESKTNGAVTVEIFANAELGGDEEITESVANGTIQMCLPSTSVFTAYDPQWGIMDMPFLYDSFESAAAAIDGELGDRLVAATDGKGFSILGFSYNGPRSMTNSKKPIYTPADLAGLKMRVMNSPVFIDMFETLGASATPMSFSELFTALQQKTVDGEENPPTLIYASNFHEVQKYLSMTEHVHNFLGIVINTNFYEGLPQEYKTIVSDAAVEYLQNWQRDTEMQDNVTVADKLTQAGMEINEISPEQYKQFVDKMAPMYDKYRKEFGDEIFDLALSFNK